MSLLDRFKTASKIKATAQAAIARRTSTSSITAELEAAPITHELYIEYFDVLLPLVAQYFQYDSDEVRFMRVEGRKSANVTQLTTQWMIEAYLYELAIPPKMLKHCYLVFMDCAERARLAEIEDQAGAGEKPQSKFRTEVQATLSQHLQRPKTSNHLGPAESMQAGLQSPAEGQHGNEALKSMRERFRGK